MSSRGDYSDYSFIHFAQILFKNIGEEFLSASIAIVYNWMLFENSKQIQIQIGMQIFLMRKFSTPNKRAISIKLHRLFKDYCEREKNERFEDSVKLCDYSASRNVSMCIQMQEYSRIGPVEAF